MLIKDINVIDRLAAKALSAEGLITLDEHDYASTKGDCKRLFAAEVTAPVFSSAFEAVKEEIKSVDICKINRVLLNCTTNGNVELTMTDIRLVNELAGLLGDECNMVWGVNKRTDQPDGFSLLLVLASDSE